MATLETAEATPGATRFEDASLTYKLVYRAIAYLALFSIFGSMLNGFAWSPLAPEINYLWNAILYAVFIAPHLVMTRSWYKQSVWGDPAGMPRERRIYVLVSSSTWFAIYALQRWLPLPGPVLLYGTAMFPVVAFLGYLLFLMSVVLFFQGISFAMIDGLLGVPGGPSAYSHGAETPLVTDGPYSQVRHPMYRAAVLAGFSTLLIHPTIAQLFWVVLVTGSFVAFIPVEEAQLIAARGDDYRSYRQQTPYRLFRGLW